MWQVRSRGVDRAHDLGGWQGKTRDDFPHTTQRHMVSRRSMTTRTWSILSTGRYARPSRAIRRGSTPCMRGPRRRARTSTHSPPKPRPHQGDPRGTQRAPREPGRPCRRREARHPATGTTPLPRSHPHNLLSRRNPHDDVADRGNGPSQHCAHPDRRIDDRRRQHPARP